MKTSLFNITREFQELIEDLQEEEGVLTEELEERLAINRNDFEEKATQYFNAIQALEASISADKAVISRFTKKISRDDAVITRLKEVLGSALKLYHLSKDAKTGKDKYAVALPDVGVTVYMHRSESVELDRDFKNEKYGNYTIKGKFSKAEIDKMLAVVKAETEYSADKTLIKKELSKLEDKPVIEGASIVVNYSLNFK